MKQRKSTPKCFEGSVAHQGAQRLIGIGVLFLCICLQYFQQKNGITQSGLMDEATNGSGTGHSMNLFPGRR